MLADNIVEKLGNRTSMQGTTIAASTTPMITTIVINSLGDIQKLLAPTVSRENILFPHIQCPTRAVSFLN